MRMIQTMNQESKWVLITEKTVSKISWNCRLKAEKLHISFFLHGVNETMEFFVYANISKKMKLYAKFLSIWIKRGPLS